MAACRPADGRTVSSIRPCISASPTAPISPSCPSGSVTQRHRLLSAIGYSAPSVAGALYTDLLRSAGQQAAETISAAILWTVRHAHNAPTKIMNGSTKTDQKERFAWSRRQPDGSTP
ncbi:MULTISPECIES: hypothetical protein [Protofrankia]|uniref:hypothetical protein n=1 Tax=Protofrankia TaxID=2994361 RepID=UPI001040F494|nr:MULTISPECIES: hypothetical protein [Protofrankia]